MLAWASVVSLDITYAMSPTATRDTALTVLRGIARRPTGPAGLAPACQHPDIGSTERRRSRTDRAVGYTTAQVLKTCWATGPVPLRRRG